MGETIYIKLTTGIRSKAEMHKSVKIRASNRVCSSEMTRSRSCTSSQIPAPNSGQEPFERASEKLLLRACYQREHLDAQEHIAERTNNVNYGKSNICA